MKNIHIIPTDKPSKLTKNNLGKFIKLNGLQHQEVNENQHIYITNNEEIKDGGYVFWEGKIYKYRDFMTMRTPVYTDYFSIILTTDQDLIKDGVQSIDDGFLEWFVKNPSCEEVDVKYNYVCSNCNEDKNNPKYENCHGNHRTHKIFKIIIPKEEPKKEKCIYCENKGYIENYTGSSKIDCLQCNIIEEEPKQKIICTNDICQGECGECNFMTTINVGKPKEETLEDVAIRLYPDNIIKLGNETSYNAALLKRKDFIDGGNWVKKRMYSEEDMREAIHESRMQDDKYEDSIFEQFKKK